MFFKKKKKKMGGELWDFKRILLGGKKVLQNGPSHILLPFLTVKYKVMMLSIPPPPNIKGAKINTFL